MGLLDLLNLRFIKIVLRCSHGINIMPLIEYPFFLWQIYVIGLGVSIAKKRKSVVDEELDSSDDDSDEELIST